MHIDSVTALDFTNTFFLQYLNICMHMDLEIKQ